MNLATVLLLSCLLPVVFSCTATTEPGLNAVDLTNWRKTTTEGSWTVEGAYNNIARQSVNTGQATYFTSDFDVSSDQIIRTTLSAGTGDDDYIGFVLGMDCTPTGAPATSCISGTVITLTFGSYVNNGVPGLCLVPTTFGTPVTCNSANAVRAITLGTTPWVPNQGYDFIIEFTPTRIRVWVDLVLEFDYTPLIPLSPTARRVGFYAYSQGDLLYRDVQLLQTGTFGCAADPLTISVPFVYDVVGCTTINAVVDWGDGSQDLVSGTQIDSTTGKIQASHVYGSIGVGYYSITIGFYVVDPLITYSTYSILGFLLEPLTVNAVPEINGNCGFTKTCNNDGAIGLQVSGGSSPYSFVWNDGTSGSIPAPCNILSCGNRASLSDGLFSVTVTDARGCTETASVTLSSSIVTISNVDTSTCGSIDLTASSTCPGVTYSWSTSDGSGLNPTSEDQSGLTAGTYNVIVTDSNSCTASTSVSLTQTLSAPTRMFMYIPTVISWSGFPPGTQGTITIECDNGSSYLVFTGDVGTTTSTTTQVYGVYPGMCSLDFIPGGSATCVITNNNFYLCASPYVDQDQCS